MGAREIPRASAGNLVPTSHERQDAIAFPHCQTDLRDCGVLECGLVTFELDLAWDGARSRVPARHHPLLIGPLGRGIHRSWWRRAS
jgi:hypothetical protein